METIFQKIEAAQSIYELSTVASIWFRENPYQHQRDQNNDVVGCLLRKEKALKRQVNVEDYNSLIKKIQSVKTFKELDKLAGDYFTDRNFSGDSQPILNAIAQKEAELEWNTLEAEAVELPEVDLEDVVDNTVVPFDLTRRKTVSNPNVIALKTKDHSSVQCGCKQKYNVPCIHRTSYTGIVPDDYDECDTCGCDHKYDPRLANEVHSKLDIKSQES